MKDIIVCTYVKIMRTFITSNKRDFATIFGALIVAAAADVIAPLVFSTAVERVVKGENIWLLIFAYIFLIALSAFIGRVITFLGFSLSESLTFFVSTRYFERLTRKKMDFFVTTNVAKIQNAFSRAQESFRFFVQFVLSSVMPGVLRVIFGVCLVGTFLTPQLAAVVLIYGCFIVWITYCVNKKIRPYLSAGVRLSQENAAFTGNAINTMEVMKYLGATAWMTKRFETRAADILLEWRRFSSRQIRYAVVMAGALLVQLVVTYILVIPGVQTGKFTVGDLILFNMLIFQLNSPFEMLGRIIDDGVRSYENLKPFVEIWLSPEEEVRNETVHIEVTAGNLFFEDVSYLHSGGRGVLNATFLAKRGQLNFIVGSSGSGKSTLFRLALKAIEPQCGKITIDGVDLAIIPRDEWYGDVAFVPQDPVLLNDSIATNIVLGREFDENQLQCVIQAASLSDLIKRLEKGLDTIVGERGAALSGGERQRIAIARALYVRPKVLFLDEASSALDEVTERQIISDLRKMANSVTIVVITHRLGVIAPDDYKLNLG